MNKNSATAMKEGLNCRLSTPELQQRKAAVLKKLQKQVVARKELLHGFVFTFPGTDDMLDKLHEFIRTERHCCPFFTFKLTIKTDQKQIRLQLTGPEGTKSFIESELGL